MLTGRDVARLVSRAVVAGSLATAIQLLVDLVDPTSLGPGRLLHWALLAMLGHLVFLSPLSFLEFSAERETRREPPRGRVALGLVATLVAALGAVLQGRYSGAFVESGSMHAAVRAVWRVMQEQPLLLLLGCAYMSAGVFAVFCQRLRLLARSPRLALALLTLPYFLVFLGAFALADRLVRGIETRFLDGGLGAPAKHLGDP